ncbi:hypothetical protein FSP39_002597, partial [Pinctada imbricata]
VMWFDTLGVLQFILETRFTKDSRKYLMRPYASEWNLHITEVQDGDRGNYRCLVNTRPVQFRKIFLEVLVSPRINLNFSSSNQKIWSGSDLNLFCDVSGYPTPNVTWFYKELDQHDVRGKLLTFTCLDKTIKAEYQRIMSINVKYEKNRNRLKL